MRFIAAFAFLVGCWSGEVLGATAGGESVIDPALTPRAVQVTSAEGFVHPGIGLSVDDLNRIQKMVRAGYEPWATAFDKFRALPQAGKNYAVLDLDANGKPKYAEMADGDGQYEARRDADAAFCQTLMWYITGDRAYADKALAIIRAWSASLQRKTGDILTAGMAVQKFCFAAEVLRYTPQSGWTDADTEGFARFLAIMRPSTDCPTAFMNQGSIATMGYMSTAVFLNDRESYDKAIVRTTVGRESRTPAKDYSLKNQIQETTDPVTGRPVYLLVEMGRDQGHAQGDIGALGALARTALVQGTRVNEAGDVVTDGSGVNLFQFMHDRLLGGAAAAARFNLGYDLAYPPNGGIYTALSSNMRGQLPPVYESVYNYYRYVEKIPDSDEKLKYVKRVLDLQRPEGASVDFFGSGTLLYTDARAKSDAGSPQGAPRALHPSDYEAVTQDFGRIQATTFIGSKGDHTGNIAREDYADAEGSRRIMSGVKINFYAWYRDVDFGALPVDEMVMRAGSAADHGCKVDVILLDNVPGLDFGNVTPANLDAGEKLGVIQVPPTGWWNNFVTFTGRLDRKLSGKHALALRFYGSNQVYHFQANVDWFKFVHLFADEPTLAAQADGLVGGAVQGDDGATLKDGAGVLFKQMDFDSGIGRLRAGLSSTAAGKLEIRQGQPDGELLAEYAVPDTGGEFRYVQQKGEGVVGLHGKNDVCLVYRGPGTLKLKTYRNVPDEADFAPVGADRISVVYRGKVVLKKDRATFSATPDGATVVFPRVEFNQGPRLISFRVRSDGAARLSLVNIDKAIQAAEGPFATVDVPDTHGKWATVDFDMAQATKKVTGSQMIDLTVTGQGAAVDLGGMQFNRPEVGLVSGP